VTSTDVQPPREPICRSADDERQPCRFADQCNERRQRNMHYASPPIRGKACWKFLQLVEIEGSETQSDVTGSHGNAHRVWVAQGFES
jgi:hypothetical protein